MRLEANALADHCLMSGTLIAYNMQQCRRVHSNSPQAAYDSFIDVKWLYPVAKYYFEFRPVMLEELAKFGFKVASSMDEIIRDVTNPRV